MELPDSSPVTCPEEDMERDRKKGFTLIEVMIVIVILSILCAITIPKFANTKERTYITSMKADLRNLATYQEMYAADSLGTYFSGNGAAQGFHPSQSVTVTATALPGPPASWTANAVHSLTTKTCAIAADGQASCT
jgi:prepilin-type N-terminal cleavage/methylation domain-containing protein